jgi:ABC-type antimicrobial peptide transport system permease subunit
MTLRTLILRSLRFHWRSHLGVVLGAAIGSAALIGALVVGDSVKGSLRQRALERLGGINYSLQTGDRLVRAELAAYSAVNSETWVSGNAKLRVRYGLPVSNDVCRADTGQLASALVLPGVCSTPDGSARANQVQIIGVNPANWAPLAGWNTLTMPVARWHGTPLDYIPADWIHLFSSEPLRGFTRGPLVELAEEHHWTPEQIAIVTNATAQSLAWQKGEAAFVNETFARQLALREGDTFILRLRKPTALSAEAAVSPRDADAVTLRLKVARILPAEKLGDFALASLPAPPPNVFLPLDLLGGKIAQPGRANLLLQGPLTSVRPPSGIATKLLSRVPAFVFRLFPSLDNLEDLRRSQVRDSRALEFLRDETAEKFTPADAQIEVRAVEQPQTATGGEFVPPFVEITSPRIFLDAATERAALTPAKPKPTRAGVVWETLPSEAPASPSFITNGVGVLTYLVNLLAAGTNATPYSMVTAAGPPWTPADLRDDEIVITDWLASDLDARPGDELKLVYFLPDSGAQLREATNRFRVRAVVPMRGVHADRTLMPEFPGIQKAESTRDWDAGFPLVHTIRDQDEAYWKQLRGTPKAFVSLAAGQKLWGNRFGNLTALRFPVPTNSFAESVQKIVYDNLRANLSPTAFGLRWEPARSQALAAAAQAQDFGGLFIGFSFFLIGAALLLMALLFQFGVEQRSAEIGTLLALGFTPKRVRRLWLAEGAALAFAGAVLGTVGGVAYARAMLLGLTTVWSDAVGGSALRFFVTVQSLGIGLVAATLVAVLTIWLTLRKLARRSARELLAGESSDAGNPTDRKMAGKRWFAVSALPRFFRSLAGDFSNDAGARPASGAGAPPAEVLRAPSPAETDCNRGGCKTTAAGAAAPLAGDCLRPAVGVLGKSPIPVFPALALAAALVLAGMAVARGDTANAGVFFGAGVLVLGAGLGFVNAWLARSRVADQQTGAPASGPARWCAGAESGRAGGRRSVVSLALSGLARCRSRSLATVALLASGTFLIASIGVFRLDADRDATQRSSGTGGFALIGEATIPVFQDLNTKAGRDAFGLEDRALTGVNFVQFRVRDGDEASCLNLNRARQPRLLGVRPEALAGRFTFANGAGWGALVGQASRLSMNSSSPEKLETGATPALPEIPAIGDAASIQWAMGKSVGATLDYVDEQGRAFKVKIVGALANSVLQGCLVVDEAELARRFPSASGYRFFLMDTPTNAAAVSAALSRALQDHGLEVTPAARRLAEFNAVQNTYLGTFQVLGGLGLLLGSAGLGLVVLRNVLERRGELALLLAVGWRRRAVQRLVLVENAALLALGLAVGVAAAAVAVLPALLSPGASLPWATLSPTLAGVLAVGVVSTWLATRWALRGNLLAALRNE